MDGRVGEEEGGRRGGGQGGMMYHRSRQTLHRISLPNPITDVSHPLSIVSHSFPHPPFHPRARLFSLLSRR